MEDNMKSRRAFTLIELLVVIAIIAILAAILFPVFATARERGKMAACLSNCKQIGLALNNYTEDHDGGLPYNPYSASPLRTRLWFHCLFPYTKNAQIFQCPSHKGKPTSYSGRISSEEFYYTGWNLFAGAIPANPDVNTWYTKEVPYLGYAFNEIAIGGIDGKRHTLKDLKDVSSIALFGDGIYLYSMWYPLVENGRTYYYWNWGKPGVQDYWGKPQHMGANTFVYADGHAASSKPVKREISDSQYGYYPKCRLL
jgi:prepilin-type N-terminal cleavage/methylation domain-containing protein/prepilin-type processing-associated H-X9-DG protein